jgi:hypothetical protein
MGTKIKQQQAEGSEAHGQRIALEVAAALAETRVLTARLEQLEALIRAHRWASFFARDFGITEDFLIERHQPERLAGASPPPPPPDPPPGRRKAVTADKVKRRRIK